MKLFDTELTNQIKNLFDAQLVYPVDLLYFFNLDTCDTCDDAGQLLDEIASLSTKIRVKKFDTVKNPYIAEKYNINLTPGLVIAAGEEIEPLDYGIRFSGLPSGYEFGSLIQAILMVSRRDSGLKPALRSQLKELNKPVNIKVFVTPT